MQPLVELVNVTFGYDAVPVLENVSLQIQPGQFAALIGPSGAGKTSLLKLLLGICTPVRGELFIGGQRLRGRPGLRIGYVPQLETIDWNFPVTVEQVVLMGCIRHSSLWPWSSAMERRQARGLLEHLGIADLAGQHIRNLSGGQQQRVFLARALIAEPELLVLDEPTTGVDMRTTEQVLHMLRSLNRQGLTILMTTHDLNAAAAHIPWLVCLNRRLIAQGRPYDVLTTEILNETYGSDMVVIQQDGMIFVQQKPHYHTYPSVISALPGFVQDPSQEANDERLAPTISV